MATKRFNLLGSRIVLDRGGGFRRGRLTGVFTAAQHHDSHDEGQQSMSPGRGDISHRDHLLEPE